MCDPTNASPPTVQEHYLTLRSVPNADVPESHRMRSLLKSALRRFGFKLVDYRAVDVPLHQRPENQR